MISFNNVESEKQGYVMLNPGIVGAVLTKVELTEDGHLDFHFKGTDPDNLGTFKPRFWNDAFDTAGKDEAALVWAGIKQKHLKHLVEGFLPDDKVASLQGETTVAVYQSLMTVLTPDTYIDVPVKLKHHFKFGKDNETQLPKYRSFISTPTRPRALKMSDATGSDGVPYERTLPMAEYGVVADSGAAPAFGAATAPAAPGAAAFGAKPFNG